ncbi:MAG: type II toxin-antitoxin system RelE/ParE family toxin [Rhizobiaceae bacterium]|nr:type II toxin-antitoxin system RelE/ParE family toxin [Rhizobiaceae bacterium]
MIRHFADAATQTLYEKGTRRGWGHALCRTAIRKLKQLNFARSVDDMRSPPGNRLHALKASRDGQWAVWVNDQYRLCFRFEGEDAVEVEITDYHDDRKRS